MFRHQFITSGPDDLSSRWEVTKFSDELRLGLISRAWDAAIRCRSLDVTPNHLLMGLLKASESDMAIVALSSLSVPIDTMRREIEDFTAGLPKIPRRTVPGRFLWWRYHTTDGRYRLTFRSELALHLAFEETVRQNRAETDTCDLLVGLLQEGLSLSSKLLSGYGVDESRIRAARPTSMSIGSRG
jgi:ATP-dependent Clp protease ATP-binding subunit ClpA